MYKWQPDTHGHLRPRRDAVGERRSNVLAVVLGVAVMVALGWMAGRAI